MPGTVAIVGAGQIGLAATQAFSSAGWRVRVLARSLPDWPLEEARFESHVAGRDTAPSADVVVDTIAFDASDTARYDPSLVGRLILVSSVSVYRDEQGRTLDEAASNGFPAFPARITEDQPTVSAGPQTYSTRKIAMERDAIARFGQRATILRPCAIHGPYSRHPREWWFVKRLLDSREQIPLAYQGKSRFQTTAAALIGDAALAAAERGATGIYNLADADSPSVLEIGQAISSRMGMRCALVPMDGTPASGAGRTPWSIPAPMILDGSRAVETLGIAPSRYEKAVVPAVDWLAYRSNEGRLTADWRTAFPQLAAYPWDMFDYAAETAMLGGME
ncbi:NAD-dependent epimerase/dehydratase family protein [Qipengyuania sp.]|uniref:NAD-dependent epimerase/dehydratase family protein n=1 Tax=Qipengyuania sp. TaxID=2004515 RepID=UPI0035C7CB1D